MLSTGCTNACMLCVSDCIRGYPVLGKSALLPNLLRAIIMFFCRYKRCGWCVRGGADKESLCEILYTSYVKINSYISPVLILLFSIFSSYWNHTCITPSWKNIMQKEISSNYTSVWKKCKPFHFLWLTRYPNLSPTDAAHVWKTFILWLGMNSPEKSSECLAGFINIFLLMTGR